MPVKIVASQNILLSLARPKLLCGKPIKGLNSDNAGEQDTPDIKDFLRKQGTQRTFTAPGSSPQTPSPKDDSRLPFLLHAPRRRKPQPDATALVTGTSQPSMRLIN